MRNRSPVAMPRDGLNAHEAASADPSALSWYMMPLSGWFLKLNRSRSSPNSIIDVSGLKGKRDVNQRIDADGFKKLCWNGSKNRPKFAYSPAGNPEFSEKPRVETTLPPSHGEYGLADTGTTERKSATMKTNAKLGEEFTGYPQNCISRFCKKYDIPRYLEASSRLTGRHQVSISSSPERIIAIGSGSETRKDSSLEVL